MDLYGCYFNYANFSSKQYGMLIANVDTQRMVSLCGEITTISVFDRKSKRKHYMGESHENSPVEFEVEIVTDDGRVIESYERRDIEKHLFRKHGYHRLYVELDCDTSGDNYEIVDNQPKYFYLNCRLLNPSRIEGNGGYIGYKCTVECDSAMAWQDPVIYPFILDNTAEDAVSTIVVKVNTDIGDYIYPKVVLRTGSVGGKFSIVNQTDDEHRRTTFVDIEAGAEIVMNGDGIFYISGNYYSHFVDKNFIRLLDGENTISITGDIADISFEFQNSRYI